MDRARRRALRARALGGAGGRLHALEPLLWVLQFAGGGSASGDDQTRLSPSIPPAAATASAHRFPCSYWRSFTSKPSSRSMIRCGAERLRRRRSIAARSSLVVRDELGGDGVHHVLGVPLDDRHRRLHPIHHGPLFRRLHQRGEPALAERLDQPRGSGSDGSPPAAPLSIRTSSVST